MPLRTITPAEFDYLKTCNLGERLKFFRKEVGKLHSLKSYSVKAMSERIGVSYQTIIAIERGDSKNPAYQLMYKITQDLDIPFEALTDEFYQRDYQAIIIGERIESDIPDNEDSHLSILGAIIYQLFGNRKMRFVHDVKTSQFLTQEQFTSLLSQLFSAFDSLKKPDELSHQPHPMVKASALTNEMDKYPAAFPIFSSSEWLEFFNNFLKQHEPKGEDE
jgi:transcriptional regulator with XRE-family HTH domain